MHKPYPSTEDARAAARKSELIKRDLLICKLSSCGLTNYHVLFSPHVSQRHPAPYEFVAEPRLGVAHNPPWPWAILVVKNSEPMPQEPQEFPELYQRSRARLWKTQTPSLSHPLAQVQTYKTQFRRFVAQCPAMSRFAPSCHLLCPGNASYLHGGMVEPQLLLRTPQWTAMTVTTPQFPSFRNSFTVSSGTGFQGWGPLPGAVFIEQKPDQISRRSS